MATESVAVPGVPGTRAPAQVPVIDKGLKKNAIGYLSNVVIGVASTAPAYSLAATLGFVVAVGGVGVHAPAIMIVSFIPMLCVAAGYKYLNRADPDCGTTFTWATRAFGPHTGWLGGGGLIVTAIIVMGPPAGVAGQETFLLFAWARAADSTGAPTLAGPPSVAPVAGVFLPRTALSPP